MALLHVCNKLDGTSMCCKVVRYIGSESLRNMAGKPRCATRAKAVRTNMMDRPETASEDLLHPAEPRPVHGEGPAGSGHF